jgi:zinc protease
MKFKLYIFLLLIFFSFSLIGVEQVIKTHSIQQIDVEEFYLNGIKICLKPTDFVKGEVLIHLFASGGYSSLEAVNQPAGKIAAAVAKESGISFLTFDQFSSFLYRNSIEFNFSIKPFTREINGLMDASNISLFLKILNSFFTNPSFSEESFKKVVAKEKNKSNQKISHKVCRIDTCTKFDLLKKIDGEEFDRINFEFTKQFFLKSFRNPTEFTCIVVGDFNLQEVLNCLKSTFSSIREQECKEWKVHLPEQSTDIVFKSINLDSAHSLSKLTLPINCNINSKNFFHPDIVASLIELRLRKVFKDLNEDFNALDVIVELPLYPNIDYGWIAIQFRSEKSSTSTLRHEIFKSITKLRTEGPVNEEVFLMKSKSVHKNDIWLRDNNFWVGLLAEYCYRKWNLSEINKNSSRREKLTSEKIHKILNEILPEVGEQHL